MGPSAGNQSSLKDSVIYISVYNGDSGFSETYTPTTDEIKAYFYGWKVKSVDANNKPTAWVSLYDGSDAPTQTLDYVKANLAPNFTPYKSSYVLATPVVTEAKVEGQISVNGLTQVEVGSGAVIREKVTPKQGISVGYSDYYYINFTGLTAAVPSGSELSKRALKILNLYKNDQLESRVILSNANAYGAVRLAISAKDYDPTAEYYVTYIVYDRNQFTANILNLIATYANSIRAALDDNVKKTEDNTREITVHANILYDILKRLKAGGM